MAQLSPPLPPLFPPHSDSSSTVSATQSSTDTTTSTSSDTSSLLTQSSTSDTSSSTTLSTTTSTTDTSDTSTSDTSTSTSASPTSSSQTSSSTTSSLSSSTSTTTVPVSTSTSTQTATETSTPTPTPTLSDTPTPTPTPVLSVTTSGGRVFTITETTIAPGATQATSQDNASSKGFFHNTGEVAGVFTVVGLVGVALIIALLTNAVRRRRAKKFDQDVAQAAAEAAAASHAPAFTDDDDYGYGADPMRERDTAERSYTGYSDNSHGTYSQQPLQPNPGESYNMNEFASFDPYAASAAGMAGAAGIGAAGVNRAKSLARTQPASPYHAFAGPSGQEPVPAIPNPFYDTPTSTGGYDSQNIASQYRQRNTSASPDGLLDAAGLSRTPSQSASTALGRNTSSGSTALNSATSPSNYSNASHYPPVGYPPNIYQAPQAQDVTLSNQYQSNGRPISIGGDIYGGYVENDVRGGPSPSGGQSGSASLHPNPYSPLDAQSSRPMSIGTSLPEYTSEILDSDAMRTMSVSGWHGPDENRHSMQDEEDYGYDGGRRVLKVANE